MHYVLHMDHRHEAVSRSIHTVQAAAYQQEAALLKVSFFPPLERTHQDIARSNERYLGVFEGTELIGSLSLSPLRSGSGLNIDSLVVLPTHQRKGLATLLLSEVVAQHGSQTLTVQTFAKNGPALALYANFGFDEAERVSVGEEMLELVRLLRLPRSGRGAD